jgi:signal peptidase I
VAEVLWEGLLNSVLIIAGLSIAGILLNAWVLAYSARKLGSSQGRFWIGLLVALLCAAVWIGVSGARIYFNAQGLIPRIATPIVEYVANCFLLHLLFRVSKGRAITLLGILVISNIIQAAMGLALVEPYVCQAFVQTSAGMSPTIEPGDWVVVNKVLGLRRWDIVAFRNSKMGDSRAHFQRLVGLPGERLRFDQGLVFVNDSAVLPPQILSGKLHASALSVPLQNARYHDGQTIVLGSDECFFIGDNVDHSADSRYYGPTDRSLVIGPADLIYWPITRFRVIR